MIRLIDADALLKEKVEIYIPPEDPEETWCFGANIEVIHIEDVKDAPTIDAEPVKQGRWAQTKYYTEYICTCCQNIVYIPCTKAGGISFNYCPYCGAKMDGRVALDET